jgi:prolyl-tRNA editing enzyme YbaK/EbsC (Cys-tRNA(Pro) deacylase)
MTRASTAVERFRERAAAHGLEIVVSEFPAGTRTADDAAAAIGCDVAQIVKSLVFVADGVPVLCLTSGANRVDEAKLASVLDTPSVAKANADQVRAATGYAIGGTPPFGHDTAITTVCDRDLTALDEVWAAAGSPNAVFPLTPRTLLTITAARVADISA